MTLYGNTVQDTRSLFYNSWKKYNTGQVLTPLELQLVDVILIHPEYHSLLEKESTLNEIYTYEKGETNPFLHMGLHLTIREQVATNRPQGIKAIYQHLLRTHPDKSSVEHLLMEPLAQCLWYANHHQRMPDEKLYLELCAQLPGIKNSLQVLDI